MHTDDAHLCTGKPPSLAVGMDDLELAPFHDKGGPVKAYQTFGKDLDGLLKELNEVLAA